MMDFQVENGGSIVFLHPLTEVAMEWVDEHIGSGNGYQPYWPTVLVEPRFLDCIVEGMVDDGLEVSQ